MRSLLPFARWWAVALLVAVSIALVPVSVAEPGEPPDATVIQQQMQRLIETVDSSEYAAAVSWDEHVVLAYRLTQQRDPSPVEFALLGALQADIGYSRSAVLSAALRGEGVRPTWAQCREFAERVKPADLVVDETVTQAAQRLAAIPLQEIAEMTESLEGPPVEQVPVPAATEPRVAGVQYNTYFGYLHAHCGLSDGSGTPLEAYTYARDVGEVDYFALTDHGELLAAWPWDLGWLSLLVAAEATYLPGSFATLWGFEWSNPFLGHINIINSADHTDAISNYPLNGLYNWLVARPEAFGLFNHPGDYDLLGLEFWHLRRYAPAVTQMVGIETWNGTNSFDHYYYGGGYGTPFSYWDVGNRNRWSLGAAGGQDNHQADWGTMNESRVAVQAESLTRDGILDAYRNRRFYATEDKDLVLDLRCQGYPMGSHLPGGARLFVVSACDGSGDTFQEVRLYRNGKLLRSKAVSGNCFEVTLRDPSGTGWGYYYVVVRQTDDNDGNGRNDEAISSPIWFEG